MPSDTYWQSMAFDGASGRGVAGLDPHPYARLSEGNSFVDANGIAQFASKVLFDGAAVFPEFDGTSNQALPLPADYASPSFASFAGWHTAIQAQFLKDQTPGWTAGDFRATTFGTSPDPTQNQTYVLSVDGRRVYFVNTLMGADIARMPLEDQEVLAGVPAFRALLTTPQGWWPADAQPGGAVPPATVAEARAKIETEILGPIETVITASRTYDATRRNEEITSANLGSLYHNLFLDQIDMLRLRLAKMAVFDPDALKMIVKDWQERFTRIERFSSITPQTPVANGLTTSVNSLDGLAGANRALQVFLRSELRIRDLMTASSQIVFTGTYKTGDTVRVADTPMMVFMFQTQQNYTAEAEAQAKSEELNEMKALIESYTKIQKLVNQTLQTFDPVKFGAVDGRKETDQEFKRFLDKSTLNDLPSPADETKLVLAMFDSVAARQNTNSFHPLEIDTNALRPTFDFMQSGAAFKEHTQTDWDLFSQNLSKVSKVLTADSQARMDEINRISRGKNRNYELASDTLNRMTDILRSIIN